MYTTHDAAGAAITLLGLAEVLLWGLFLVACYFVTRWGVRDGIRDSGLIEATRERATTPPTEVRTRKWSNTTPELPPDMRADR